MYIIQRSMMRIGMEVERYAPPSSLLPYSSFIEEKNNPNPLL